MFFLSDSSFPLVVVDDPGNIESLYLVRTKEGFVKTILHLAFSVYKIQEKNYGFKNVDSEEIDLLNAVDATYFSLFYEKDMLNIIQKLHISLSIERDLDKVRYLFNHDDVDGSCDKIASKITPLMRNAWIRDIVKEKNLHKMIELYCVQIFMSYFSIEFENIFEI